MKTKYFGKVSKKDWGSEDIIKISKKSGKEKHYYYMLEVNIDSVWLRDSCGRGLPIDQEHIPELLMALECAYFGV